MAGQPRSIRSYDHLGETNWSLLSAKLNHWHEPTAALMRPFRELPDWRIDDLMISFSVRHGGVGYLDQYDVFIIQNLPDVVAGEMVKAANETALPHIRICCRSIRSSHHR